jgi:hypothetical protein
VEEQVEVDREGEEEEEGRIFGGRREKKTD